MSNQPAKPFSFKPATNTEQAHDFRPNDITDYLEEVGLKTDQLHDCSEFVLCVTRVWSRIVQKNAEGLIDEEFHDALNIWTQKFVTLGGKEAAHHWDKFLACLTQNNHRQILLGCRCCGRVSDDEKLLLAAICDIQTENYCVAQQRLSELMRQDATPNAVHHLKMFNMVMNESGAYIDVNIIGALYDTDYTSKHLMH